MYQTYGTDSRHVRWLYLFLGGFCAGVLVLNIWRNYFLQDMELLSASSLSYLYRRGCRVGICSMDGDNGGNFFVRGIRPIWAEGDCIGLGKRAAPLFIAGACLHNAYGLVLLSEHGNVSSGAAGRGGVWQGKAISGQENTASAYDGGYPYRGERSGNKPAFRHCI